MEFLVEEKLVAEASLTRERAGVIARSLADYGYGLLPSFDKQALEAFMLNMKLSPEEQSVLLSMGLVRIPSSHLGLSGGDDFSPENGSSSTSASPPYPLFEGFCYFTGAHMPKVFATANHHSPLFQQTVSEMQTDSYCCGLLEDNLSYLRVQNLVCKRFGDPSDLLFEEDLHLKGFIPSNPDYVVIFARRSILTERYVVSDTSLQEEIEHALLADVGLFISRYGDSFISELQYEHYCLLTVTLRKDDLRDSLGLSIESLRDHFGVSGVSNDMSKLTRLFEIKRADKLKTNVAVFSTAASNIPASSFEEAWDYFWLEFPVQGKSRGSVAYKRSRGYETSLHVPFDGPQRRRLRECRDILSGRSSLLRRKEALMVAKSSISEIVRTIKFYGCTKYLDHLQQLLDDANADLDQIILYQDAFSRNEHSTSDDIWRYDLGKGIPDLAYTLHSVGGGDNSAAVPELTPDDLLAFCRKRNYVSNVREFRRYFRLWPEGITSLIVLAYNRPLGNGFERLEIKLGPRFLDHIECFVGSPVGSEPLISSPEKPIKAVDETRRGVKINSLRFATSMDLQVESQNHLRYELHGDDFFFVGLRWNKQMSETRNTTTKVRTVRIPNHWWSLGFLCCKFSLKLRTDCYSFE